MNKTQLQKKLNVELAKKALADFDKAKRIEIDAQRVPLIKAITDAQQAVSDDAQNKIITDLQTQIAVIDAQPVDVQPVSEVVNP